MKITFYLKDHGIGALDLDHLSQLWHLLKPQEGKKFSPLLQYSELMELEDLLLLVKHGYLKLRREVESKEDLLCLELNVRGSGKEKWGLSVGLENFEKKSYLRKR